MTDDPDMLTPVIDVPHAPFVFYEAAPAYGLTNGIVDITLSAGRTRVGQNDVIRDHVAICYLRGNLHAAVSLRDALDKALRMAAQAMPAAEPVQSTQSTETLN